MIMRDYSKLKYLVKIIIKYLPLIGIILFLYLIYDLGIEKIIDTFIKIPPLIYLASVLVFLPKLVLATMKWQYICKKQNIHAPYGFLARLFMISSFYGSITPGYVGVHMRIYYLKEKTKTTIQKCIANSFIDATLTFLGGLFLSILGVILYLEGYYELLPILIGLFIADLLAFLFFLEKRRGSRLIQWVLKPFLPKNLKENISDSVDLLYEDIPKPREAIIPFLLELVIWSIAATQVYVLSLTYNLSIPFFDFIMLSTVSVVLGSLVPISVGGLGIREGIFVIFLAQYGVPYDIAFVLSIAGFIVKRIIPGLVGFLLSFHEMKILKKPKHQTDS